MIWVWVVAAFVVGWALAGWASDYAVREAQLQRDEAQAEVDRLRRKYGAKP